MEQRYRNTRAHVGLALPGRLVVGPGETSPPIARSALPDRWFANGWLVEVVDDSTAQPPAQPTATGAEAAAVAPPSPPESAGPGGVQGEDGPPDVAPSPPVVADDGLDSMKATELRALAQTHGVARMSKKADQITALRAAGVSAPPTDS